MILNISPQTESIISHIASQQGVTIEQFFINSAYEKALQLAYMPNAETRQAIDELASGQGEKFNSIDELMADLNA